MTPTERGRIDLIEDFAAAIPVQLIGDMLGIPQDERGPLRDWSLKILGALEPVLSPEQFNGGVTAVDDFKAYLRDLVARRQREGALRSPAKSSRRLIGATDLGAGSDGGGDRLSELELLHNCIFLLNAGHETTTNLIGNAVDLLLRHPDALRDLAAHPEAIETAVEEFLRMESSNQLGNRRAVTDTRIGDIAMPAGTYVHLCIGAANRDPAQFSDPDRLDIRREPNRHLAFGFGIHTCAGNSLARMEAQVAIGKLVRRFRIDRARRRTRARRPRPLSRLPALSRHRLRRLECTDNKNQAKLRNEEHVRMSTAFDFTPLRPGRPPGRRGEMDRLAEIQLHRRQQRFRRAAARRPDRRRQFGAQARGPHAGDLRLRTAARRAIARCATFWSESSSATPASTCTADDILVTSGSLQALDLVNGVMLDARRHRRSSSRSATRARSTV